MKARLRKSIIPLLVAAIALGMLFATGCFRHQFERPGVPREAQPRYARWHHHLVAGIIQLTPAVDLAAVCPNGVAKVANHVGPIGWLLGGITVGIYMPTSVVVWCQAGPGPVGANGQSRDVAESSASRPVDRE